MLYRLGWLISKIFYGFFWAPSVTGREHVPDGPFLLCPTHRSWFDPPLVGSRLRQPIAYLAKRELFSFPIFGWILRRVHAIPIRRGGVDRSAVDHAMRKLKAGMPVLVFPEGTRSRTGKMLAARPGVGMMARQAGVPVVPAYLDGTFRLKRVLFRYGRLNIRFGKPITPEELASYPDSKDGYRDISWLILRRICDLGDDPERLWREAKSQV